MKATITRPDGTRIEAEGTPAEIALLAGVTVGGAPHVCAPCPLPHFPQVAQPIFPVAPVLPCQWLPLPSPWRWPYTEIICGDNTFLPPTNVCAGAVPMANVWVANAVAMPPQATCAVPTARAGTLRS